MEDTGDCVQRIPSSDGCPMDHTDCACSLTSLPPPSPFRREDLCAGPSKPSAAHTVSLPRTLTSHSRGHGHSHGRDGNCHLCAISHEHRYGGAPPPIEPENPYPVNPILDPHLSGHDITNRYHNVRGYIFRWTGTVNEVAIVRAGIYTLYSAGAYFLVSYVCSHNIHEKCNYFSSELSMLFTLWMAFLAYLFQSFVNAGLDRFNLTNAQVRSTQGRLNDISLLCHSHATPKADNTLRTIQRLCSAFPFVMHAPAVMGGTPEFVDHIQRILEEDEFNCLMKIREGDRVYAMCDWMMILCIRAFDADEWRQGSNLVFQLQSVIARLRGTVGTLIDSLDDAMLPFPFINLITINIYLVFALLPIVMAPLLGPAVIVGAVLYFLFLDGMITLVFMVDRPFTALSGKRAKQPLVNLYRAMQESSAAAPRRFPSARDNRPSTVNHPEDIVHRQRTASMHHRQGSTRPDI